MALLPLGNAPRVNISGVPSVSAFVGDDCSAPEEKSTSIAFCGVVKGKFRKEKGGFVEGVDGGRKICDSDGPVDSTVLLGGESRKLAEPGKYRALIILIPYASVFQLTLTLLTCKAFSVPTAFWGAL